MPMTGDTPSVVEVFLQSVEHPGRREDALALVDLMRDATSEEPALWKGGMVGFGRYHYVYDSGHEGDAFLTGFAPRKANMVVYIMPGFSDYEDLLARLGKHKTGKSCLYLGRLKNVDTYVLRTLVRESVDEMRRRYPANGIRNQVPPW